MFIFKVLKTLLDRITLKVMRMRGNQILIQTLLIIIITTIVIFVCINLADWIVRFCYDFGEVLMNLNVGF